MAFELSFSDEFFYGNAGITDYSLGSNMDKKPTSILQALCQINTKDLTRICLEIGYSYLGYQVTRDELINTLMQEVKEVNTCTDLSSPVEVWIDELGDNTVLVYE